MDKEDQFLRTHAEDLRARCEARNIPTHTAFLDMRQQSLLTDFFRTKPGIPPLFLGGYEEAERCVCAFLPDYMDAESFEGIACIRIKTASALPNPLTHRDYLGAMMGLGIKRETVGDILVREDGADIIVLSDMAEILRSHFEQAGRARFRAEQISFSEMIVPVVDSKIVRDTVPSLRLDCVLSSAFRLSRGNAGAYIEAGRVFVNGRQILKNDYRLQEGDKITLRGHGKAILRAELGRSKKDRIFIELETFG